MRCPQPCPGCQTEAFRNGAASIINGYRRGTITRNDMWYQLVDHYASVFGRWPRRIMSIK
jgi:hypothetical protein